MKRIISLLICISLLLSTVVLAQNVAFVLEPIVVRYNENAARSEDIVIKGSFDESIVLRVFDNNGNLLYVDNTDSTKDGLFEFKAFKLEKPDVEGLTPTSTTNDATRTVNKYTLDYKFVISNSSRVLFGKTDLQQGINETVQVEYSEAIIKGQVPDGPDGPSVPKEDKVPEWDGYIGGDTTDTEPSEIPAYEDPRNPYGQNEALWDRVNKVTTDSAAASIITKITKATKDEAMAGETARNNVAFKNCYRYKS